MILGITNIHHLSRGTNQNHGVSLLALLLLFLMIGGMISLIYWAYKHHEKKYKLAFVDEILILIAYILNLDEDLSAIEKIYISRFLLNKYGKKRQQKYIFYITQHIKGKRDITPSILKINSESNISTRLQILHLLIKTTTSDGYLSEAEFIGLANVTAQFKLTQFQLKSMLAMHSFVSEKEENGKRNYKRKSEKSKAPKQNWAFSILELSKSATNDEIKKSYRKLVVLYHPDKIMHLDSHLQKAAKEMYQKVNDAYDYLKEKKGFK